MSRDIIGEIIFWAAFVFGLTLYFFSSPTGLPWNGSTELALAYGGYIEKLPEMSHPVWGYFVWLFGGHYVALSAVTMAIASGLIGALLNRYFGWRVGVASALAWITLPPVWNRAVTGVYGTFWAFAVIFGAWLANAIFLIVTGRARKRMAQDRANAQSALTNSGKFAWANRIAAWGMLVASVAFAIVSISKHDYTIGEAASAYARVTLEEAGDRVIVLNGLADDQMVWEAERRESGSSARLVQFRNDAAYRTQLVARVRREWPAETNLWISAQIGPSTFADLAVRRYPERMYVMTGQTTTAEKWAARWEAMKPYLGSSDHFIPRLRRAFAYEGNVIGNRLQGEGKLREAWAIYWRITTEIDRSNVSALVNESEMIRRGYQVSAVTQKHVEDAMVELGKLIRGNKSASAIAAATVAACGPVMPDSKALAAYRELVEKHLAELKKEKNGKKWEMPDALKSLFEWNGEMIKAHDGGDIVKAARIARAILSNPEWRSFVPANAVMGTAMAVEGDYVAAERFYNVALQGNGPVAPTSVILNDYADVLRNLGRYDEAEQYARRAVREDDGKQWIYRITLAQTLRDAKKNPEEMQSIVADVLKHAPIKVRAHVRKEFGLAK